MEVKFGLRLRDSKPSDTGSRGHTDPTDVDAVNSRLAKKKDRRFHMMVFQSAREHTFSTRLQCTQNAHASNRLARTNRASHGPRVEVKDE